MTFFDLRPEQQIVFLWLAEGLRTDNVGREIGEMGSQELRVVGELVKLGLVDFQAGWNETGWYSLKDRAWGMIFV